MNTYYQIYLMRIINVYKGKWEVKFSFFLLLIWTYYYEHIMYKTHRFDRIVIFDLNPLEIQIKRHCWFPERGTWFSECWTRFPNWESGFPYWGPSFPKRGPGFANGGPSFPKRGQLFQLARYSLVVKTSS